MNIKPKKVDMNDMLRCDSCKNIAICKLHELFADYTMHILVDNDDSDTILTSMRCKYHTDSCALHIKSTPEDFAYVKKLLNEGTGIEYLQNQPESVVKKDDQATCSTNETHDNCHGCRAEKKAMYEEPCSSCYDHALFVKRS